MKNIQAIISLSTIIFAMVVQSNTAYAAPTGSIEFMCKSKAKEVAAETYSGCINDNKQAELDRIRKEYQAELAKVKAKYNNELQSLGGGSKKSPKSAAQSAGAIGTEMPAKKMKTSKVKTEKIDFSSDKTEESQPETLPTDADGQTISSTEIVEIPVQEE